MSLRLRLALGTAAVLAVSFGVLGFVVVGSTRAHLMSDVRHRLEQSLTNRINAGPPPATTTPATADPRVRDTAHVVIAADGSTVAAEPAGPPTAPTPLPAFAPRDIAALRLGHEVTVSSVDGALRYLALGRGRGDQLEVEAAPLDSVDSTMSSLTGTLLGGALVVLLLAVIAAVLALRHGMRPLDEVIATADAVAAGEREQRIPTDRGPAEIRHLSVALDRMLEQQRTAIVALETSEAHLRQFVADASHELQTPITSVLGWTQLIRRGALDDAGTEAALARIEAESRRMAALVEDLLLLARIDERRPFERRPVDLTALALDAVTDARAVEPDRPIALDAPATVLVHGDALRLRQVIDNLLRNVRAHTAPGTWARVAVEADGPERRVVVEDGGPGIPAEHLDHVFDRFWRRDASRSRATGGTGLGLAIAAAIVGAHGGTITATNRRGGGALFTVVLPAA